MDIQMNQGIDLVNDMYEEFIIERNKQTKKAFTIAWALSSINEHGLFNTKEIKQIAKHCEERKIDISNFMRNVILSKIESDECRTRNREMG